MHTAERADDDPDAGYELIRPEDFLPTRRYPSDARRLGIDQYTGLDGAWIGFASALDGRKPSHRAVAVALLVMFVGSFALSLWGQMH